MKKLHAILVILTAVLISIVTSGCGSDEVRQAKAYQEKQRAFRLASRIRAAAAPERIVCPSKANEMLTQVGEGKLIGNVYTAKDEVGRLECWDGPGIDERGNTLQLADEHDLLLPRAPMPWEPRWSQPSRATPPRPAAQAEEHTERIILELHIPDLSQREILVDLSQREILPDLSQRPCQEVGRGH